MRTSSKSALAAYLLCFVAGGATIGLAAYALHLSQIASVEKAYAAVERRASRMASAKVQSDPLPKTAERLPAAAVQPLPIVISRADIGAPAIADAPAAKDDGKGDALSLLPPDLADLDETATTEAWTPSRSDSYRTVCVRMCDGSYTPISFATTRDRFKSDAIRCEAGCGSPVRMFFGKAGAGDVEDMIDVHGASYVDLPNAFKFRTLYDESCTCRGQPWDEASLARHRALQEIVKSAPAQAVAAVAAPVMQTPVPPQTQPAASVVAMAEPGPAAVAGREDDGGIETGPTRHNQSSSIAMTADLPALAEPNVTVPVEVPEPQVQQKPVVNAPAVKRVVKPVAKAAVAAAPPAAHAVRKPIVVQTVKPAAKALASAPQPQHRKAVPSVRTASVAVSVQSRTNETPSRGLLADIRGRERAQRTFKGQDFWRLTYWEPKN